MTILKTAARETRFELDSEQDELRKALLIKQETDFDFLLLLVFANS